MKMNKKGFTLIELLAVIIILAIIALIATPIVMNVINRAQKGADLRSVEAYGKAAESAYYQYQIDNPGEVATSVTDLTTYMNLSGNEVTCDSTTFANDKLTLSGCRVAGRGTFGYTSDGGATNE